MAIKNVLPENKIREKYRPFYPHWVNRAVEYESYIPRVYTQ